MQKDKLFVKEKTDVLCVQTIILPLNEGDALCPLILIVISPFPFILQAFYLIISFNI